MDERGSSRPEPLFSDEPASDPAYRNLRFSEHQEAKEGREFAEYLWRKYYSYADANFLVEIRKNFHARFWEMYLTCALLEHDKERGYLVSCPKQKKGGPDILLEHAQRRIWIEAVTATDGEPGRPDSIVEPSTGRAYKVPDEKIILRYAAAIAEKQKRYLDYRAKEIVAECDAYIIAVNAFPLAYRWADPEIPRILKAVFPLGPLEVVINKETTEIVETRHQVRPYVSKVGGALVSTQTFLSDDYMGISAVIHSYANACVTGPLGADFLIVHNPQAACTVPHGLIPAVREYTATAEQDGFRLAWRNNRET